tara:strand:- start:999 stop:1352 length:354 start_codon:yes stop_codon:yes gene_type:complete
MSIKLAILKSGEHVISDVKELVADEKLHGYLFQNAYVIESRPPEFLTEEQRETGKHDVEVMLSPWLIFSDERKIPVRADWLVTIVEPVPRLKEIYEERINVDKDYTPDESSEINFTD